jgi:Domain of unknown function (DUF6438)
MCFGTCPVFEMRIGRDRRSYYKAIQYNETGGEFNGVLSKEQFDTIMAILRYLPLDKLDSSYAVEWTDDQTVSLEIKYNGQVIRITDYGAIGSFGLQVLYAFLFKLRGTVPWEQQ